MGEGCAEIGDVTGSSAANIFKTERAQGPHCNQILSNHPLKSSVQWELERLSADWVCSTKSPLEGAQQSNSLERWTAHPWEGHVERCSPVQSIPLSSQSPLTFLLAALTVQIAEQCQDQSSMVGNQKAWKENINRLLTKLGFSLWKVVPPTSQHQGTQPQWYEELVWWPLFLIKPLSLWSQRHSKSWFCLLPTSTPVSNLALLLISRWPQSYPFLLESEKKEGLNEMVLLPFRARWLFGFTWSQTYYISPSKCLDYRCAPTHPA